MTSISPIQPARAQPTQADGSAESAARLTNAVALVGGVRGALRSGLLEALWRWQPCTTTEIATRVHLSERTVALTLAALAVGGVVVQNGEGRWELTAPPEAWALLVGFEESICRFVESGAPTRADGDNRYTGVLPVIGRFHDDIAIRTAPLLTRPNGRVLELGAGTAPWSRAMLASDPTVTAVAVDLPPVIAMLQGSLRGSCLEGRIELVAQDVRSLTLAGRFDVVVLSGLCRLLGDADNAQLIARCVDLLAPGGRVVICDAFAGSADPDGSLALYSLGLAARSRAEALWSARDYERWLDAAGCTTAAIVMAERAGVTALIASIATQPHLVDHFDSDSPTGPPSTSPSITPTSTGTARLDHKDHS